MSGWTGKHDIMARVVGTAVGILMGAIVAFVAWALITIAIEGIQAVIP